MSTSINVGNTDRIARAVIGILLVVLPLVLDPASPAVKWIAIVVGIVLIATAAIRFCPLYRIIGANTCNVSER